jgi:hypothetical protein
MRVDRPGVLARPRGRALEAQKFIALNARACFGQKGTRFAKSVGKDGATDADGPFFSS